MENECVEKKAITAFVVTYNEERRLRECLQSLAFCGQLIVVDLGSTDGCVEIAKECGAEVVCVSREPVVEMVWGKVLHLARNDWILRADPDEVFSEKLAQDVFSLINNGDNLAIIALPHRYFFLGKPLLTTRWGNVTYVPKVFHRQRVIFSSLVHRGIIKKDSFETQNITFDDNNAIQHYWVDSYRQLFEKHWRYIQREGEARYKNGERIWLRKLAYRTRSALRQNLIDLQGLKGGWSGIFLSFFYAWYEFMSMLSLWRFQNKMAKSDALSKSE